MSQKHTNILLKYILATKNKDRRSLIMALCELCPRKCRVDRSKAKGFCGESDKIRIARIAPHFFEEPPISGSRGSGTVFFSGCTLRCVYCQNKDISRTNAFGKEYSKEELTEAIIKLQQEGVHNINLVTPTHFADKIADILYEMKKSGLLRVPIVYNTSGYESIETLKRLDGLVDIYMPDLKYFSPELSQKYSSAPDYFERTVEAIKEMIRQRGAYRYSEDPKRKGLLDSGVLIRHLVLPTHRKDSEELLSRLASEIDVNAVLISIMSQYTPEFALECEYKELHRRITSFEYEFVKSKAIELGFDGFMQARVSADSAYTPNFKN